MSQTESSSDNPLSASMERIRQEMERWVDMARSSGSRAWETIRMRGQDATFSPALNLTEVGDHFHVELDLPGVDPEAIDVTLAGNMLTVSGRCGVELTNDEGEPSQPAGVTVHIEERPAGRFSRSLPLPAAVDADDVQAELKHGVLKITLCKTARSKPHTIPVRLAEGASTASTVS